MQRKGNGTKGLWCPEHLETGIIRNAIITGSSSEVVAMFPWSLDR